MPIDSRELKHVRTQSDGTVRVQEVLTASVGHRIFHSYAAASEAEARIAMNARNVTEQLKEADFTDLLAWTQAKNNPDDFDFTGRDLTLLEGEERLMTWFATRDGEKAITIAWWIKGMNNPAFNPIRDRLGIDVTDGNTIRDRAVDLDGAERSFSSLVDVG